MNFLDKFEDGFGHVYITLLYMPTTWGRVLHWIVIPKETWLVLSIHVYALFYIHVVVFFLKKNGCSFFRIIVMSFFYVSLFFSFSKYFTSLYPITTKFSAKLNGFLCSKLDILRHCSKNLSFFFENFMGYLY